MREPLLPRSNGPAPQQGRPWMQGLNARSTTLCVVYVLLSASGPILLDWVKRHHGGRFRFCVPALTFHAWGLAALIGFLWTLSQGREGLRQLNRPDMLWRFCITSSLFTAGDMLGFASLQHLDVGTYSLLGKSLAIIVTLVLSRVLLKKPHTKLQYLLVVIVAAATVLFCHEEQNARGQLVMGLGKAEVMLAPRPVSEWLVGLVQRCAAVGLTSLGAVTQEYLFTREPGIPFLMQQCWMGVGAMVTSLFTLRVLQGVPFSHLTTGFGDWRVIVLLTMYVASGMTTGLVVKQLGAVAKALCVPIFLGFCYAYAVKTGTAALTPEVVVAWSASTACVLLFAVSKACNSRQQWTKATRGESL